MQNIVNCWLLNPVTSYFVVHVISLCLHRILLRRFTQLNFLPYTLRLTYGQK